jgi:hypothetical protein
MTSKTCVCSKDKKEACKACTNAARRAKYQYWSMIDDIIDKPVGKGESLYEAVGDGNSYSAKGASHE